MSDVFSASAIVWKLTRSAELGSRDASAEPQNALYAAELAQACLAAAAAHAALRKITGWGPPSSLDQYRQELGQVLPGNWQLPATRVPAEAERALLDVITKLHRSEIPLSTYYEGLLQWDWRSGTAEDPDRRRSTGAFHTPQDLADLAVGRLAQNIVHSRFGPRANPFGREALVYLSGLAVADLAVGAGRFPVAWLSMFDRGRPELSDDELNSLKLESFRNLEFTDIDRPALELAVIACAVSIGPSALSLLNEPSMRHGNALIDSLASETQGNHNLNLGHIWHPSAGVNGPSGNVDVIIGNPPWERVRYEAQQFMRGFGVDPQAVAEPLVSFAKERKNATEMGVTRMRADERLSRSTHGEIYTHVAFTELAMNRTREKRGWVCHIVKSTMLNSPGHSRFMADLLSSGSIAEVWDFKNTERIFAIDSRERFAVLIASHGWEKDPRVVFGLTKVAELENASRLTPLSLEARQILSPELGILPACSGEDLELLLELSRLPTFRDVFQDANFGRLLHLTNHAEFIHPMPGKGRVPVWEGRMIEQFTSKFSTWAGVPKEKRWMAKTRAQSVSTTERADRSFVPESRWWVEESKWVEVSSRHRESFSVAWRNASAPTNRRTVLATSLRDKPTTQSIQIVQLESASEVLLVLGIMNSLPFDWLVRRRMAGIDVTSTLIRGTPVPHGARWDETITFEGELKPARDHVNAIVAQLLSENSENDELILDAGHVPYSPPIGHHRRTLQRRLDVLIAWGYGLDLTGLRKLAADFPKELSESDCRGMCHGMFGNLDSQL